MSIFYITNDIFITQEASGVYIYFVIKIVDLLDTMFFVLRKKASQVSFLHLYHHAGIVFGSWVIVKYVAGGQIVLIGNINIFFQIINNYNKEIVIDRRKFSLQA